jgi:hypothetical protein
LLPGCTYGDLRADHWGLHRYRMTETEILAYAAAAVEYGYGTVVMQSGEDEGIPRDWMAGLIRKIKEEGDVIDRGVGFSRGANVVMPNLSPVIYRADYEIYPSKACIHETAAQCRTCLEYLHGDYEDRKIDLTIA